MQLFLKNSRDFLQQLQAYFQTLTKKKCLHFICIAILAEQSRVGSKAKKKLILKQKFMLTCKILSVDNRLKSLLKSSDDLKSFTGIVKEIRNEKNAALLFFLIPEYLN